MTRQYGAARRRALNMVWTAAGRYDFTPPFLAFDADGRPVLYLNCIIGLAYRWFGADALAPLFESCAASPRRALLDDLVWMGLESCLYEKEAPRRPALEGLRREYAASFFDQEETLSREQWLIRNELVYALQTDRWRRVLSMRPPLLTPREQRLARALELPGSLSAEEAVARLQETLRAFFPLSAAEARGPGRLLSRLGGIRDALGRKLLPTRMARADRLTLGGDPAAGGTPSASGRAALRPTERQAEEDRAYLTACFGPSALTPGESDALERALCTGNHAGCRLWLTRGAQPGAIPADGEARRVAEEAAAQYRRNLDYYAANRALLDGSILRLSAQLKSALRTHTQPQAVRARAGRLDGRRVWRAVCLQDPTVFRRDADEPRPDFSVDLLLDASASRRDCQESIAAQGYVIAESLRRCGIPVQVSAFRSLRGYTVTQVFETYGEADRSREIFRYFAAGWNRDGLALRTAGVLLRRSDSQRRILLVLTDAGPNDSRRIPPSGRYPLGQDYGGGDAIRDAADEVRALRREGVRTAAVVLGVSPDTDGARSIYGASFARIRSIDRLAPAVGALLEAQIRELP